MSNAEPRRLKADEKMITIFFITHNCYEEMKLIELQPRSELRHSKISLKKNIALHSVVHPLVSS